MSSPFARRMLVFFLAVVVTAGMGLSVVQASAMSFKMMDMPDGMMTPGMGSCSDCPSGESKGMTACANAGCFTVAMSPNLASATVADLAASTVRHHPDVALLGRDVKPDPYPPRSNPIG